MQSGVVVLLLLLIPAPSAGEQCAEPTNVAVVTHESQHVVIWSMVVPSFAVAEVTTVEMGVLGMEPNSAWSGWTFSGNNSYPYACRELSDDYPVSMVCTAPILNDGTVVSVGKVNAVMLRSICAFTSGIVESAWTERVHFTADCTPAHTLRCTSCEYFLPLDNGLLSSRCAAVDGCYHGYSNVNGDPTDGCETKCADVPNAICTECNGNTTADCTVLECHNGFTNTDDDITSGCEDGTAAAAVTDCEGALGQYNVAMTESYGWFPDGYVDVCTYWDNQYCDSPSVDFYWSGGRIVPMSGGGECVSCPDGTYTAAAGTLCSRWTYPTADTCDTPTTTWTPGSTSADSTCAVIAGMCGGNTWSTEDVDCGTAETGTVNRGASVAGSTFGACCVCPTPTNVQVLSLGGHTSLTWSASYWNAAGAHSTYSLNAKVDVNVTSLGNTVSVSVEPAVLSALGTQSCPSNAECILEFEHTFPNDDTMFHADTEATVQLQRSCRIMGRCTGNTDPAEDVTCPTDETNKGVTTVGTTADACCSSASSSGEPDESGTSDWSEEVTVTPDCTPAHTFMCECIDGTCPTPGACDDGYFVNNTSVHPGCEACISPLCPPSCTGSYFLAGANSCADRATCGKKEDGQATSAVTNVDCGAGFYATPEVTAALCLYAPCDMGLLHDRTACCTRAATCMGDEDCGEGYVANAGSACSGAECDMSLLHDKNACCTLRATCGSKNGGDSVPYEPVTNTDCGLERTVNSSATTFNFDGDVMTGIDSSSYCTASTCNMNNEDDVSACCIAATPAPTPAAATTAAAATTEASSSSTEAPTNLSPNQNAELDIISDEIRMATQRQNEAHTGDVVDGVDGVDEDAAGGGDAATQPMPVLVAGIRLLLDALKTGMQTMVQAQQMQIIGLLMAQLINGMQQMMAALGTWVLELVTNMLHLQIMRMTMGMPDITVTMIWPPGMRPAIDLPKEAPVHEHEPCPPDAECSAYGQIAVPGAVCAGPRCGPADVPRCCKPDRSVREVRVNVAGGGMTMCLTSLTVTCAEGYYGPYERKNTGRVEKCRPCSDVNIAINGRCHSCSQVNHFPRGFTTVSIVNDRPTGVYCWRATCDFKPYQYFDTKERECRDARREIIVPKKECGTGCAVGIAVVLTFIVVKLVAHFRKTDMVKF